MHESSVTSIHDLTDSQIMDVLRLAEEFEQDRSAYPDLGKGLIMGSLFLEPSTRTRGSFESAMLRLGGDVITVTDAGTSSIKKGETLGDTARIWSSYCDLIVLRHPWEGAAAAVAEFSGLPVINAGDGGNEHPTQTLVDLFTLMKEYGRIDGLSMAICGDLRQNRSVHSLIYALLRFGVDSYLIAPRGFGLPDHVRSKIRRMYGVDIQSEALGPFASLFESDPLADAGGTTADPEEIGLDALYVTNSEPHQLTMVGRKRGRRRGALPRSNRLSLYLTRRQREREQPDEGVSAPYPRVTQSVLRRPAFQQAIVMHPLPRVDEIASEVDKDHRSRYFQQASYGVPVRQALVALVTGRAKWSKPDEIGQRKRVATGLGGMTCASGVCVSVREPASAPPKFTVELVGREPAISCRYCGAESRPGCFRRGEHGVVYHDMARLTEADIAGDRELFVYPTIQAAADDGLTPSALFEPTLISSGSSG